MLAKVTDRRGDGRTSFKSLFAYITRIDDDMPQSSIKTNCLSLATAATEMRAVADQNGRVRDPVYHVVLSWQHSEHPTDIQMFEAGDAAVAVLGMTDHQYVFAIHRDTDNAHLHLMVNRVHPETGRAVHPGLSYLKLDRCMRELELAQGWGHDRGAYAVVENMGEKQIERVKCSPKTPKMPTAARDMEAQAGEESLFTYASAAPKQAILAALKRPDPTWQDLYAVLAQYGLELRIKGQGLGLYAKDRDDLTPIKASSVHESLGRGKLEKRLGPYELPIRIVELIVPEDVYLSTRNRQDGQRDEQREARAKLRQDVRARYDMYRNATLKQLGRDDKARRATEWAEYQAVLTRHQATRAAIRISELPGLTRKALYSVSAFERARDLAELKEAQRTRSETRILPQTYREWIEAQAQLGDEGAISQLHGWYYGRKRRHIEPVKQANWSGFMTRDIGDIDPMPPTLALKQTTWRVDRQTGDVQYYQHDQHVFTDSGQRVAFNSHQPSHDAMLAGLLLAREKFGPNLNVVGDAEFKTRAVQLAVTYQIHVMFGDSEMEVQRQQLEAARQPAPKATNVPRRSSPAMPARGSPNEHDEPGSPER